MRVLTYSFCTFRNLVFQRFLSRAVSGPQADLGRFRLCETRPQATACRVKRARNGLRSEIGNTGFPSHGFVRLGGVITVMRQVFNATESSVQIYRRCVTCGLIPLLSVPQIHLELLFPCLIMLSIFLVAQPPEPMN